MANERVFGTGIEEPKLDEVLKSKEEPKELTINKETTIRKFDLSTINAQIDKAIASLPADKRGAVVGVFDGKQAHLAVVGKVELGPGELAWTAIMTKPYDGKLEYEGQVRYSF